jgi:hypothetical protein
MPTAGFETTVAATERTQTEMLESAGDWIGRQKFTNEKLRQMDERIGNSL